MERIRGLVERQVGRPNTSCGSGRECRGCSPDLVEHHDGVVQREPEDGQDTDDGGGCHLETDPA